MLNKKALKSKNKICFCFKNILGIIKKNIVRFIIVGSVLGYVVVPFIHNYLDSWIAKLIWFPSNLFLLVFIFLSIKNTKVFEDPLKERISNVGIFLVIPILPSVFVFNYYNIENIWKWVIFAYAFILIPYLFWSLFSYHLKQKEYSQNEKGKIIINMAKYIALFWLVDLLYMAIFNGWLIATFIFGILILILIVFNLSDAFLHGFSNLRFFMALELVIGSALSGYLIYIIPNEKIQNIVLTIFAALVGGIFTLLGVAWTIKKADNDRHNDLLRIENERREEERKKYVPYIRIAFEKEMPPLVVNAKITEILDLGNKDDREKLKQNIYYSVSIENFKIKNISNTNIILNGVKIDGIVYAFKQLEILEPNTLCLVQTTNNYKVVMPSSWPSVCLVLSDILGNQYEAKCTVSAVSNESTYSIVQEIDGNKFTGYDFSYKITSIGLPILITEESTNKKETQTI